MSRAIRKPYGDGEKMAKKTAAKMDQEDTTLMVNDASTFIDEVRRYLSVTKVKRMFGLGTELFAATTPFLEKPTWWNAGKSLFAMGKTLVEDVEVWADDYFSGDEWVQPYSPDFNQTLLHVLQKFPYERIKTLEDNTFVRICTMPNGVKAGWTYLGRLQQVDHVYVEAARVDEARDYIKQLLWEQFKGKSLVMRKNNRMVIGNDEARVIFEVDDVFESKLSKRALELSKQLERPLSKDVSRSIMFYGPPGTGKSTLARTIVELMNLRSFRIRIADLGGLDNSTLFEAINIFEPDAVILDDFDRAHGQEQLLETLEFFQQKVKLVIATVNDKNKLDSALLRPGRIDILELVDKMDQEVVKHVLGEYADGYDLVKDWPIAFITEYVKRRSYLSAEEAADSVKELTQRVADLNGYHVSQHEDMEVMLRVLKKAKLLSGEAPDDEADDPFDTGD
jgi:ATPase family protein associated with various cellular activities (AAA)